MIRYSLTCDNDHGFEGWFGSSADYEAQTEAGLVSCPLCASTRVTRALMAPSIATGRSKDERRVLLMDAARRQAVSKIREIVSTIRAQSDDVGDKFPEEARKIHYGEADARGLIGSASPKEALALIEEGIRIAPLPVLPDDAN